MNDDTGKGCKDEDVSAVGDSASGSAHIRIVPTRPGVTTQVLGPQLADALKASVEGMASVQEQYLAGAKSAIKAVAQAAASLSSVSEGLSEIYEAVFSNLAPMMKALAKVSSSINWDEIVEGAKVWGSHGWAVTNDQFYVNGSSRPPASLAEADKEYLGFLDLDAIFIDLESNVRKKKDTQEAIELFREKHYKPCAMMLCSLIDRELLRVCCGPRRNEDVGKQGRRQWSRRLKKAREPLESEERKADVGVMRLLDFVNICAAVFYFFDDADDFKREIEGELNRNFLDHGMMYKPVRRKTCVKLFVLLDAVASALPGAWAYVTSSE